MKDPLYYLTNKISSIRDLYVLQTLAYHKRMNVTSLANNLVSRASVTTIITKLAKKGLVVRVACCAGTDECKDGRNVYVEITPAGEELIRG